MVVLNIKGQQIIGSINSDTAVEVLKPLIPFIIGMVIYAVFIFKFYKFISKRDIFDMNLKKYLNSEHWFLKSFFRVMVYIIEYLLLFPLFTFFWFVVMTILLSTLAREQSLQNILLLSITIVAAVRATAYYNEDLAQDLAKTLPFALLGVFLVNLAFLDSLDILGTLKELPTLWETMLYYLLFAVLLEFVLRIIHFIISLFRDATSK